MAISPPLIAPLDQDLTSKRKAEEVHTPSHLPDPPADWVWKRLDRLCIGTFDCPHSTPALADNGPYVVRTQDIRTGTLRLEEAAHVSETTYTERVARAEPRYGDILYSREGTYFGIAAEVPPGVKLCLGQRMFLIRPNQDVCDHRFLKYWLNSPVMSGHIAGYRDGSVAERLNLPTIRSLPVVLPPLPEQRAIAHILGTMDDKIELNRRMSATLEAMARALFKSWFVDFEPVRAKAEGRDPGLPPHLAALFPDRLIETDHGEVPEGWRISSIGEEVRVVGGSTPSTSNPEFWDGEINWATPKDLSGLNSPVLLETSRKITTAGLAKISSGLLPAGTVLLSSRAPIGYLAIAEVPVAINQGFIAMVCERQLSNTFVWLWTLANMEAILAKANGSTFQEVSKSNFRPLVVVMPPRQTTQAFDGMANALCERITDCERQSRTLTALRDTLLPKLISGDLRVKDADTFLDRVL